MDGRLRNTLLLATGRSAGHHVWVRHTCSDHQGRPEIALMADYGCYTWTDSDALFRYRSAALNDNLDLARLGATVELASALSAWHAEWEQHAWGDLRFSAETADAWERRGWALARQLQDQLPDIDIHVWDYDMGQVVDIPSETKQPVYGSRIS